MGALRRRQGVGGDSEASAVYSGLFAAGLFAELTSNETNAAAEKVRARRRPVLQLLEFRILYHGQGVGGDGPRSGLWSKVWSMVYGLWPIARGYGGHPDTLSMGTF